MAGLGRGQRAGRTAAELQSLGFLSQDVPWQSGDDVHEDLETDPWVCNGEVRRHRADAARRFMVS